MKADKQKLKDKKQKTEVANQNTEIGNQKTEDGIQDSEFEVRDSEAGNQEKAVDSRLSSYDFPWLLGCAAVTLIALIFRFYWLELKPLHHDEGVNGFFLTTLFREGVYKYDPSNYHGPTLYYVALAFTKIFGLNTLSIRSSTAIFGVLTIILAFFLKDYIGKIGSLAAALFLALSPGMVFISRYFIHELLFVFFSFAIVISVLYFIEKRNAGVFAVGWMSLLLLVCFFPTALSLANTFGEENAVLIWFARVALFGVEAVLIFLIMRKILEWNEGRPIYLMLASASVVLLFATKETAFVTVGTMAIACLCVWIWRKIYKAAFGEPKTDELEPVALNWTNFRARLGDKNDLMLLIAAVTVVFVYVGGLFLSSFLTYSEGVSRAFND